MKQGGWIVGLALAGVTLPFAVAHASLGSGVAAGIGLHAVMDGGYGHSSQGYLGVELRDVGEDEVGALKLKDVRGAEIVNVDHDGPGCKAGMQVRDVILQVNGQVIDDGEQLRRILRELPAGRTVSFVITRDGQTQTLTTQMADRRTVGRNAWEQHYSVPDPESKAPAVGYAVRGNGFMSSAPSSSVATQMPKGHRDFLGTSTLLSSSFTGAQLELMGPQLAQFFGAENGEGLLVRSVDKNSPAEAAGMKAGDVVVRINSIQVASDTDWTKMVRENRGRPMPVVVIRDKQEQTLTLTPDAKKRSSVIDPWLEEFFQEKSQQTRELWAKL
jgi:serine protease Do